jgi:hypothetical protein
MARRFFFNPPRRVKKPGPNLKRLLVRCPTTAKLSDTGQTIAEKQWLTAEVKQQTLTCSHCGAVHTWTKEDVILGRANV